MMSMGVMVEQSKSKVQKFANDLYPFSPHISQVEAAEDALSARAGYSCLYLLLQRQSRCSRMGLPTFCKFKVGYYA